MRTLTIINDDTRDIEIWSVNLAFDATTINYSGGSLSGNSGTAANVTKEGNTLIITGTGDINAMTHLAMRGLEFGGQDFNALPTCELSVSLKGNSNSGSHSSSNPIDAQEIADYFADKPCGVGLGAMGNGGWSACWRTEGAMAMCTSGSGEAKGPIKWKGSDMPVTNVMHISTFNDTSFVLITDEGDAYLGRQDALDSDTPLIEGNAITSTGGKHPACIMTGDATQKGVLCAPDGNYSSTVTPTLPNDFNAMQISAGYGYVCALNDKGAVWCWLDGGNAGSTGLQTVIFDEPSASPFTGPIKFISAGQNTLCGVKFSGGAECWVSKNDANYIGVQGDSGLVKTDASFHPTAFMLQSTYHDGVMVDEDGTATHYKNGKATIISELSSGDATVGRIISAGGQRGGLSVVNENGDVFSVNGGAPTLINGGHPKAQAGTCRL